MMGRFHVTAVRVRSHPQITNKHRSRRNINRQHLSMANKYSVISGAGRNVYSGNDYEECVYQRDEFSYEYPEVGAAIYQNF